jgi:flavoprotein
MSTRTGSAVSIPFWVGFDEKDLGADWRAVFVRHLEECGGTSCTRVKSKGAEDIIGARDGRLAVREDDGRHIKHGEKMDRNRLCKELPEER